MPYVLALDQGTTSSRAIVFDHDGRVAAVAQREFPQIFPRPGWVEHDPQEIWATQMGVAAEALGRAHLRPRDLAAIGITNQRETTVVWDRETGQPIYNAIVWQDRRTAEHCERLKAAGHEDPRAGADGPGRRCLLLRDEGRVDPRQRAGRSRPRRGGQARVRHDRLVARLEADERQDARHRCQQRVADDALRHPQAGVGRGSAGDPRRAGQPAAAGARLERGLRARLDDARHGGRADRRDRRRPAGGAVRTDVRLARTDEEHLRHRLLPSAEHGHPAGRVPQSPADDGRLDRRRAHRVRAGRQRLHWRRGGAVAARRPGADPAVIGRRGAGRVGARQRGRVPGARLRRARRPALGPVRPGHHRRHHPGHHGGTHRPGRAREHRLPGGRSARRRAPRLGDPARGAQGGRRRVDQRRAAAVPG